MLLLRCMSLFMAQMRNADRIDLRLSLEAERKTSTKRRETGKE
jgi:hypothetical protein